MSQAFTVKTGGLVGESVDRVGGLPFLTAQLDLTKKQGFTGHQHGSAGSSEFGRYCPGFLQNGNVSCV